MRNILPVVTGVLPLLEILSLSLFFFCKHLWDTWKKCSPLLSWSTFSEQTWRSSASFVMAGLISMKYSILEETESKVTVRIFACFHFISHTLYNQWNHWPMWLWCKGEQKLCLSMRQELKMNVGKADCWRLQVLKLQEDRRFFLNLPPCTFLRSLTSVYSLHKGSIIRNISVKEFPHYVRCEGNYFWENWCTERDLEIVRLRETGRAKNTTVRGDRERQPEQEVKQMKREKNTVRSWESSHVFLVMEIGRSWRQQTGLENELLIAIHWPNQEQHMLYWGAFEQIIKPPNCFKGTALWVFLHWNI